MLDVHIYLEDTFLLNLILPLLNYSSYSQHMSQAYRPRGARAKCRLYHRQRGLLNHPRPIQRQLQVHRHQKR